MNNKIKEIAMSVQRERHWTEEDIEKFAELIIVKCLSATDSVQEMFFNAGLVAKDQTEMLRYREAENACFMVKTKIEMVFGIEDAPKT